MDRRERGMLLEVVVELVRRRGCVLWGEI